LNCMMMHGLADFKCTVMFRLTQFCLYTIYIRHLFFSYNLRSSFDFTWVCMWRSDEQMCPVEITT